ncbi:hypothetical protein CHELA40_10343 [Chelatococcus asaccharovorans]|nr:hypothetical protein CHELA40_10343 [Chelatococcus asaccharovorans]CAH1686788.1 hypothetical protein CHELA17_65265 [Chelatococcus asaccharovorans]
MDMQIHQLGQHLLTNPMLIQSKPDLL